MVNLSCDVNPHVKTKTPHSSTEQITVTNNLEKHSSIIYKNGNDVTKDKLHTNNIGKMTFFK